MLQWQERFEEADDEFSLAAEETGLDDPTSRSSLLLLATVLQHRAKNRFDRAEGAKQREQRIAAARWREAACEDADRALAIRESLGASEDLLASSRETVARLSRPDQA